MSLLVSFAVIPRVIFGEKHSFPIKIAEGENQFVNEFPFVRQT